MSTAIICSSKDCPAWAKCDVSHPRGAGCKALRATYGLLDGTGRVPESPYIDDNVLACPNCGSGEYLHNQDGNENAFCGQCGQPIDWEEKQ